MKKSKYYTCEYCFEEYVPKRRGVQRFCSNSCRSKNHHMENKKSSNKELSIPPSQSNTEVVSKVQKEKMSLAGTGNAAAGSLLADGIKKALTKEENRAATKGDLKKLEEKLTARYFPINNLPINQFGQKAFYDIDTNEVVYLGKGNVLDNFKMG